MGNSAKIRLLKPFLPRGYAKDLATKFDVTESLVWMVANGDRNNPKILAEIVEIARKTKLAQTKLEKDINSII